MKWIKPIILTLILFTFLPVAAFAVQDNARSEDKQTISFEIIDADKGSSTTNNTGSHKGFLPQTGEVGLSLSAVAILVAGLSVFLYLYKKKKEDQANENK